MSMFQTQILSDYNLLLRFPDLSLFVHLLLLLLFILFLFLLILFVVVCCSLGVHVFFLCLYDMDCPFVCCSSFYICVIFLLLLLLPLLFFSLVTLHCVCFACECKQQQATSNETQTLIITKKHCFF